MKIATRFRWTLVLPVIACLLTLTACQSMYYGTMEKFGVHKRDILVDRVEDARESQEDAKEEFETALERFSAVVNFDGGNLEANYRKLDGQFEDCKARADRVSERIDDIEDVAGALFREWEAELDQYTNADLQRRSAETLRNTQSRYNELITVMHRAESKMAPVLSAFQDQVLFLKHNLNAQAIAALQGDVAELEGEIANLIADMNSAIAEANAFIDEMASA